MKQNEKNLIDVLTQRVYDDLAFKQIEKLLMTGKRIMEVEELTDHISCNINKYLSVQEQNQLVLQNHLDYSNDVQRSSALKFAVSMTAVYIRTAMEKVLLNKKFVGDNPYSPIEHPVLFMIWKFWEEKMGVKLNIREMDMGVNL